jgi:glucose/mannose transport system permease protein
MFGAFFPWALYLLPLSRIVNELGMSDSMLGLIIVHIIYSLPQALFFRNQFIGFSDEVVKAARIDGAGLFTIFWRIVLPANREIFVVVLIIQFTAIWNDFLFALVLSPYDQQPVTVGINNLTNVQMGQPEHNVYMAGAFIAALPVLILYLVAGKFFLRGLGIGVAKN